MASRGWTFRIGRSVAAAGLALGVAISGAAQADPLNTRGVPEDEWRFTVSPYLFLPVSTSGTTTVADASVDIDLDLQDIFEVLNLAVSARAEAWRGDFGLIVDGYYVNIGGDETIGLPGPAGGTVGVDVSVKQGWVDLLGAYRLYHGPYDDTGRLASFDVQAGVRYNNLRQEVDADLSVDIGPGSGRQTSLGGVEVWWEPVVGARGAMQLNDRWSAAVRADFGGFGVGGDDLQWKVLAGADYRPWDNTSLKFGWQVYGIDFSTDRSDGEFAYDVVQTGPYLGLTFGF